MVSNQVPGGSTTKHQTEGSEPPPTYSESASSPRVLPTPQIVILQEGRYAGTPTTETLSNSSPSGHHHPFFGAPPGSPTIGSSSPRTYGPTPMSHDVTPAVLGSGTPVYLSSGAGMLTPGGESGALLPLPYYDRSSPYSEEQANSRARWRFIEAFAWAFAIWITLGVLFGTSAVERSHRKPHHRHDEDPWFSR